EAEFGKARTAGTAPGTIVSAALRQLAQLHKARLAIEAGASLEAATAGIQPLHFSRKGTVEAALRIWTAAHLKRAMAQRADAALHGDGVRIFECRSAGAFARPARPLFRQRLHLAHVEAAIDDFARHFLRIWRSDQHARGAGADLARIDVSLHRLGQLQEPQHV